MIQEASSRDSLKTPGATAPSRGRRPFVNDILFGLFAVLVGLFLCLWGQWALRILLAVWGGFVGLALGAGLVDSFTDEGFLAGVLGWTVGLLLAVVFAAVAYLYFVIGITLAMAAMGTVLGATVASALGATSSWVLWLVGASCGIALAALALLADLPQMILIVISSLTGASVLVVGLMLIFGVVDAAGAAWARVSLADEPWWFAAYVVTAIVGIAVQSTRAASVRASIRDSWA